VLSSLRLDIPGRAIQFRSMKNRFFFGLTILVFLLRPAYGRPKPHYTFVLPDQYVGWIQVVFNDRGALPLPKRRDGGYQIDVPESGLPRTSDVHVNDAKARDEFYYRVQLPDGTVQFHHVPAEYVLPGFNHGGFTMMDADGKGSGSSWYLFIGRQKYGRKFLTRTGIRWLKNTRRLTGGKRALNGRDRIQRREEFEIIPPSALASVSLKNPSQMSPLVPGG
jgi:hypothetical protein